MQLQPGLPGWQPLYVLVTAPEEGGRLVFMCSVTGQDEQTAAFFDDCALYRIPAAQATVND